MLKTAKITRRELQREVPSHFAKSFGSQVIIGEITCRALTIIST